MTKRRALIYSHFVMSPEDPDVFICKYCGTKTRSTGGTSNIHKHMIAEHPEVDRMNLKPNSDDEGESGSTYYSSPAITQDVPQRAPPSGEDKKYKQAVVNFRNSLKTKPYSMKNRTPHVTGRVNVAPVETPATPRACTESPQVTTTEDVPASKVLVSIQKMQLEMAELKNKMNLENAELRNLILQSQFEAQKYENKVEELRKTVEHLKRGAGLPDTIIIPEEDDDGMPKFPLFRMSDVDLLEERISSDEEFKSRLAVLFKSGQSDKVAMVLNCFSSELLVQFTYKSDRDSSTTHRCTEWSEIFELMYCK